MKVLKKDAGSIKNFGVLFLLSGFLAATVILSGCKKKEKERKSQKPQFSSNQPPTQSWRSRAKEATTPKKSQVEKPAVRQPTRQTRYLSVERETKNIMNLNAKDLEIVNDICRKALRDCFGDSINAWYKTTYYRLPTSDYEASSNVRSWTKLDQPVTLISAQTATFFSHEDKIIKDLKEKTYTLQANHRSRKYRIIKCFVLSEIGGGMTSIPYSKITIVPFKVSVD